jgi:hypothetical protein
VSPIGDFFAKFLCSAPLSIRCLLIVHSLGVLVGAFLIGEHSKVFSGLLEMLDRLPVGDRSGSPVL